MTERHDKLKPLRTQWWDAVMTQTPRGDQVVMSFTGKEDFKDETHWVLQSDAEAEIDKLLKEIKSLRAEIERLTRSELGSRR